MPIQLKSDLNREKVMGRNAKVIRKTSETDIEIYFETDGTGEAKVDTGIGFFDHMLKSFARHGLFNLDVKVKGDIEVDCHHTIEDTGIVLGEAIKKALGDKKSIRRYGSSLLPMDETLVMCAIDLSGRPYLVFDGTFNTDRVGYAHHIIEAMFKAFARALDEATRIDRRVTGLPTTKGAL